MSLDDPVIITCAISGALANREQCPAIPYTPQEYAAEARRIVDEGGAMIHIHARRPDGTPSYEVEDFEAIVGAIRAELRDDDVIVNLSTGAVGVPVAKRIAYLRALRPDVAALNMGSMNYAKYSATRKAFVFSAVFANPFEEIVELLQAMNELGIRPECECFDVGHVGSLAPMVDMRVLRAPLHVDCVMGVTGGIPPTARNLAAMVDNIPAGAHWGVVGVSRVQWTLVAAALALGGSIRVGLEDNLYLPGGAMARSNGELVARARRMTVDAGRRPATVAEARAMLGGAAAMSLPLEGVRVLDLSRLLPGGFCSLLLADYGADVLKVEDTAAGDYIRWSPPRVEGAAPSASSALFLALNRNKRSIRLDLKQDAGREVLLALVREHDVVLESFRPGVLDRLGVGYEAMRTVNPRIVLCSITGYGQDGPLRDRAGHDINYLALTGVLGLTGEPGGPPVQSAGQIADLGGGALMAAFGILAALREAERTGEGQVVDVAMADGALSWLALVAARVLNEGGAAQPPARGMLELAGGLACYRPYACADGGWVALGALEPKFWATWCRGVGREDLIAEQFAAPGSTGHAAVEAVFAARTRADWAAFAADHECCLEPVLDLGEALSSGQVRAREMVVALDQPGATEPVSLLGAPVKLSRTPADCNRLPGPELGEHTEAVLRAAGYAEARIAELLAAGAVAGPPDPAGGAAGSFLA